MQSAFTRRRESEKRFLLWDVSFGKVATLSILVSNASRLRLLCQDLMRCCTSATLLAWLDWFVARGKVRQPGWLVPDAEEPMTRAEDLQTLSIFLIGLLHRLSGIWEPVHESWMVTGLDCKSFSATWACEFQTRNEPSPYLPVSRNDIFLGIVKIQVCTSSSHIVLGASITALILELPTFVIVGFPSRVRYQARQTAEFSATSKFVPGWCLWLVKYT